MEENNDFLIQVSQWTNDVLVWIGFGTLAGLLAKAIMPGKDPGGAVATLAMGVGGTVIGCGVLTFFTPGGTRVTPISVAGFAVATAGSFVILFFYKLLGGFYFREGDGTIMRGRARRKTALRRPAAVVYEDE